VSTNTSRIDAVEVARAAVRSSNRPKLSKCDQRAPNTPHAKSVKIGVTPTETKPNENLTVSSFAAA
jgi:hypothetical protein